MKRLIFFIAVLTISTGYGQKPNDYLDIAFKKFNTGDFKEYKEIVDLCNKAIKIESNNATAYLLMGSVYSKEASLYKKQVQKAEDGIADGTLSATLNKKQLEDLKSVMDRQFNTAMKCLNKSIEINPTNAAYYTRGRLKSELNDFRGSIMDYNKAIELNANDSLSYESRGIAKLQLGQKEDACLDLSKAGELGIKRAYDAIKEFCK